MKLLRVKLENVFAYKDAEFDLSETAPGKNIVLIWGRNGMGKTSFLNAVKLLFTGIERSEVRRVGFPPSQLTVTQYVLGDGVRWTGLVNRQARLRALSLGEPLNAEITLKWQDEVGEVVTATRWWTVDQEDFTGGLVIERGVDRKTGAAAEEFLENTIPADLVKFFFFDGEEIKSIAESSGSLQSDFNRLLQITFLENLARELVTLSGDRKRSGLEASLRKDLDDAQADLRRAKSSQLEARERIDEIDAQLGIDGVELRRAQIRRANLSSGASEVQKKVFDDQQNAYIRQLNDLTETIVRDLPKDAPILANLGLVRQTLHHLAARLVQGGSSEVAYVSAVTDSLGDWIAEGCPALSETEGAKLSTFLSEKMRSLLQAGASGGMFDNVSVAVVERIIGKFEGWSSAGDDLRAARGRLLLDAYKLGSALAEVRRQLLNLEVGANSNVDEYRGVSNKVAELEDGIAKQNQLKGVWAQKLLDAAAAETKWGTKVTALEESQNQVSQAAKDSRFVLRAATALNEISERLKTATRTELEDMLNDRFKRIIQHNLIDRIALDEGYVLSFFEKSGKPVGRTSLSSGMKQLAATALLWAMKDSAGSNVPVIIDTPLGRIDRENQEHLLRSYYPVLADQVIVLPTNAEIDERKLGILGAHVATHYSIINEDGDAARVERRPLVEI